MQYLWGNQKFVHFKEVLLAVWNVVFYSIIKHWKKFLLERTSMAYFGFKDLSSLSDVEMTIYRYVMENSDKVVYMRVRDIAENAHVANSSVMRFIHKLGFNSFPEFKAYLRNIEDNDNDQPADFSFVNESNFPSDIKSRINMVADLIYQSDNIITIGLGDSSFLAEYAARKMAALGYNSEPVVDPFYPLKSKLNNTSNTTIICFSVSGKTTEMIEMLNTFINDEDVTLVAVTGNSSSSIATMSRYVLSYIEPEYRIQSYYDMSSQVPVMYIVELLVHILANLAKQ